MENAQRHVVLLVPGFFGFANFGTMAYFGHVKATLERELDRRGLAGEVDTIRTHPTGSLRARAARLIERIAAARKASDGNGTTTLVHVIGHSSGGLDARMLLGDPDALPSGCADHLRAVRSVITVATPHRGTPLATWFRQFNAAGLMRLLSVAAIHVTRVGPIPLGVARQIARLLGSGYGAASQNRDVIDQIIEELLDDFGPERRAELRMFFEDVGDDQTLLDELGPERLPGVLGPTPAHAGVRCGAVVTRARKPWLGAMAELGFDATAQTLHLVFRWLQTRTSAFHVPPPVPDGRWTDALRRGYGELPGGGDNDGIVPTRSQIWGEPIDVVWADHMDVLGHFAAPGKHPPHFDWLPSGSRYRSEQYHRTWNAVASFIAAA